MNPILKNHYRQQLKTLGLRLRELKKTVNACFRAGEPAWSHQVELRRERERYRYLHLAYGFHRGRTIAEMERNPRSPHEPEKLRDYQAQFESTLEVVHAS